MPVLQITQPRAEVALLRHGHADRQRVGEQADHPLDLGELGRAPRGHGAEAHLWRAGVAPQRDRPHRLQQGAERHLVAGGGLAQPAL